MSNLLHPDRLLDLLGDLLCLQDVLIEHLHQDALGPLYDILPLGGAHILDAVDCDAGNAWSNPVDGLKSCGQNGRLYLIKARGNGDGAAGFSPAGGDLHINSAQSSCFLKISEIQIGSQEAFGLSEDSPDHIRPLHYPLRCYIRINNIFSCINILHLRHLLF